MEELDLAEDIGILLGGFRETAAKRRADDGTHRPDKRHDRERSWLELLLGDHFCDHRANDANYGVVSILVDRQTSSGHAPLPLLPP